VQHLDHADTTTPATCPSHRNRDGAPVWCPDCRDQLATLVWRLPGQRDALLAASDGRATRPAVGRGGTRVDPPSPSPEFDQADEIDTVLAAWGWAWLQHHGAGGGFGGRGAAWAARVLGDTHHGHDVWAWEQAEQLGRDVRTLAAGARRLLGGTEGETEVLPLEAPCPGCGRASLAGEDGGGRVGCRCCSTRMTEAEYAGWSTWLLASAGRGSVAA